MQSTSLEQNIEFQTQYRSNFSIMGHGSSLCKNIKEIHCSMKIDEKILKNVKITDNAYSIFIIPLRMTYFSGLVISVYKITCHLCCRHSPKNSLGNI